MSPLFISLSSINEQGGRERERERETEMFFSATVLLIFSCMVCVNIQVRSASWDVPINTAPSFTTYRLYTSKINHRRQTYIHEIYTRCDFFVFLLLFFHISKYIPTHTRIHSLMSIIHAFEGIYHMYINADEEDGQYFSRKKQSSLKFLVF
jgi:hypothetical protein